MTNITDFLPEPLREEDYQSKVIRLTAIWFAVEKYGFPRKLIEDFYDSLEERETEWFEGREFLREGSVELKPRGVLIKDFGVALARRVKADGGSEIPKELFDEITELTGTHSRER